MNPETTPATKPQPVLIVMATLAGLQVLTGGTILTDLIGPRLGGFFILVVAAAQTGMGFYLRGQVVPFADVRTYINDQRDVVAGPAADIATGTPVTDALTTVPPGLDGSGPIYDLIAVDDQTDDDPAPGPQP